MPCHNSRVVPAAGPARPYNTSVRLLQLSWRPVSDGPAEMQLSEVVLWALVVLQLLTKQCHARRIQVFWNATNPM